MPRGMRFPITDETGLTSDFELVSDSDRSIDEFDRAVQGFAQTGRLPEGFQIFTEGGRLKARRAFGQFASRAEQIAFEALTLGGLAAPKGSGAERAAEFVARTFFGVGPGGAGGIVGQAIGRTPTGRILSAIPLAILSEIATGRQLKPSVKEGLIVGTGAAAGELIPIGLGGIKGRFKGTIVAKAAQRTRDETDVLSKIKEELPGIVRTLKERTPGGNLGAFAATARRELSSLSKESEKNIINAFGNQMVSIPSLDFVQGLPPGAQQPMRQALERLRELGERAFSRTRNAETRALVQAWRQAREELTQAMDQFRPGMGKLWRNARREVDKGFLFLETISEDEVLRPGLQGAELNFDALQGAVNDRFQEFKDLGLEQWVRDVVFRGQSPGAQDITRPIISAPRVFATGGRVRVGETVPERLTATTQRAGEPPKEVIPRRLFGILGIAAEERARKRREGAPTPRTGLFK